MKTLALLALLLALPAWAGGADEDEAPPPRTELAMKRLAVDYATRYEEARFWIGNTQAPKDVRERKLKKLAERMRATADAVRGLEQMRGPVLPLRERILGWSALTLSFASLGGSLWFFYQAFTESKLYFVPAIGALGILKWADREAGEILGDPPADKAAAKFAKRLLKAFTDRLRSYPRFEDLQLDYPAASLHQKVASLVCEANLTQAE